MNPGLGKRLRAVRLIAREAFGTLRLMRLGAATSPTNVDSQIVLLRNGFTIIEASRRNLQVNGVWRDSVRFERTADPDPGLPGSTPGG